MRRVKVRVDSGPVCEQVVYSVPDGAGGVGHALPRLRFASEEERARHRMAMARRDHARTFNTNFSPSSLYATLTFDNDWEVHTFEEARRIRENFIRALRRACPDCRLLLYMGRGKGTSRIHFHMVSEGLPEEVIRRKWKYGQVVRIERLREHNVYNGVDHGQDYTGLANYLFDHWSEEQKGHHYYRKSGALEIPRPGRPREVKRAYSETKPPRAPKGYILVESRSTRYGYLYFKYVKKPGPRRKRNN